VDRFGLTGDRRWMLVDEKGCFLSQRELPRLARLTALPTDRGLGLRWGEECHDVAEPIDGELCEVQVWDDRLLARDAGYATADWLQAQLGLAARLVYMPDDCRRLVDSDFAHAAETVSFADGFPLLLVSAAAADELNARLSQPVSLDRFRPNLVVSGCAPHAEDGWQRLRIGEMVFDVAKPCARCVMPSVDQVSGEKHPELLRVLADYRRGDDRKVYFGQNLLYRKTGSIAVGDPVQVLG
jgi:uncharacterized protein YcbX